MKYFDNAATTFPKPDLVLDSMNNYSRFGAVNAGRGAYKASRESSEMIKETRNMLISLIDAKEQAEVVFTPSVTIALNEVICGFKWTKDSVAYVSPFEHNSVLRPLYLMREKYGISIIELPLTSDLAIDLDETEKCFIQNHPDFVAITAVSNVTGYILPVQQIFKMAKRYDAFTLLDGSQAIGLLKMRFSQLNADVLTFAGHKTLYGPFGIGGFFIRHRAEELVDTVLSGGTGTQSTSLLMPQNAPDKYECGSKDTVAICGLHASLNWLKKNDTLKNEEEKTKYLFSKLTEVPNIVIYSAPDMSCQAGIVSINIQGFLCGELAAILDNEYDIAVRAGHHCAALVHKHLKNDEYKGTVRISLGFFNSFEDIDCLVAALKSANKKMLQNIDRELLRGLC
ncbi:MAG: aminotransferase class V-fold PLP-dependent enzyme [Oscillospiraceae bacterium]|nr:aminotransferase class V-fold PLP-dependent enzyme [Oscillospiraceae bacterium]